MGSMRIHRWPLTQKPCRFSPWLVRFRSDLGGTGPSLPSNSSGPSYFAVFKKKDSSSSSSSSFSSPPKLTRRWPKFDVFLSFRGLDIRNNFVGHLYRSLDREGIYTFIDSKELRVGDEISPSLMTVIKQSRVAIVLLSERYPTSAWCLSELAKIMECKALRGLRMKPGSTRSNQGRSGAQGRVMPRHWPGTRRG